VTTLARIHYEIPDDVHQKAKAAAAARGITLKDFIVYAIEAAANRPRTPLGELVQRERLRHGYTFDWLAHQTDATVDFVREVEQSEPKRVPLPWLRRFAQEFGLHPAFVFGTAGYTAEAERERVVEGGAEIPPQP